MRILTKVANLLAIFVALKQGTIIVILKGQCREIFASGFFMISLNLIPVASVLPIIFKFLVTCDKKLGDTLWLGKFGLVHNNPISFKLVSNTF